MKSASPKQDIPVNVPAVRILQVGTCPSLSGKSTLTYHIGCTDNSEIRLRIFSNTGGGFFGQEWIALTAIKEIFQKIPKERPITSFVLRGLFSGKSVNSNGFFLAILKHEQLVKPLENKQRYYEALDPSAFIAKVKALVESSVDLKADSQPKPVATTNSGTVKDKKKGA